MAAVLIVLLYVFFVFSGIGAADQAGMRRAAVPFAPCRLTVRYAAHSVLPAERLERRQMERPVVWLARAQVAPLDSLGFGTAPQCAVLHVVSALLCGSHPQRAPPVRA